MPDDALLGNPSGANYLELVDSETDASESESESEDAADTWWTVFDEPGSDQPDPQGDENTLPPEKRVKSA